MKKWQNSKEETDLTLKTMYKCSKVRTNWIWGLIGRLVYWYKVQLHLICILLKQKIGSYFFSSSSQVSFLHVAIFCQNVATFWSRFRPSVIRRLRWSFWWSFFSDLMPDLVYEQHDCQFANLLAKNELTKKLEFQIDFNALLYVCLWNWPRRKIC